MKARHTHLALLVTLAAGCGEGMARGEGSSVDSGAAAVTATGPLTLSMAAAGPLVEGTATGYSLSLTNTTASAMTSVTLAADFSGTQVNQVPTGCVRLGGGLPQIFCSAPSLAPGATLAFDTQIKPITAGTLTFGSSASSSGNTVVSLQDVENVAPAPTDVQVTGSSSNGSPPLGSVFTYTFQVKNNGPFPTFGGVSFTDDLPASLGFAGVSTSLGTCTGGATVACTLGDLPVGAQANIQISVQAPLTAQTIVDTASVAIGAQTDRNPANNSVSVTVTLK